MINQDLKHYGRKEPNYNRMLEVFSLAIILAVFGLVIWELQFHPRNRGQLDCQKCHSRELQKRDKLANYFRKNGSKTPEEMANAVLQTRSPRLMAAMAVRESGGNHNIRKTGWKRQHNGAFQVNPKHWGKVSDDPIAQALQAEAILTELTQETGGIRKALNAYGGDRTKRVYAANILRELQEVPR
jgi:hypothetical protein